MFGLFVSGLSQYSMRLVESENFSYARYCSKPVQSRLGRGRDINVEKSHRSHVVDMAMEEVLTLSPFLAGEYGDGRGS
jgi:hypothetical protein